MKIITVLFLISTPSMADVLFEGYSKILSQGKSIGYLVQRYEFDKGKKQFSSVSFTRVNDPSGSTSESIKATCTDKFEPVSFFYTFQGGDTVKTIDGKFAKGQMTLKTTDGKAAKSSVQKTPKGIFLSSFLGYLMLKNGFKVGKKFSYQAIAEEDGSFQTGQAFIQKEEKFRDFAAYRMLNEFKKVQYISHVNARGEVLGTESPAQNLSTELVKDLQAATEGQLVPTSTLVLLFGKVPEGKKNLLHDTVTPSAPVPTPTKSP